MPSFLMLNQVLHIATTVILEYDSPLLVYHCSFSENRFCPPLTSLSVNGGRRDFCRNCSKLFAVKGLCVKKWQIMLLSSWGFRSYGMRCCVVGGVVSSISEDCVAFVFTGQAVKAFFLDPLTLEDEGITILWNNRNHSPSETASHPRLPQHHCENSNLAFFPVIVFKSKELWRSDVMIMCHAHSMEWINCSPDVPQLM